jgi:hypothetical protein
MVAINNDQRADGHQFCYGDMIELARQMIDQTTDRLDSVYLRKFYDQLASPSMRSASSAGDSANGFCAA